MHILAGILMFVVLAIVAACNGDFSGIEAIGKFVGVAVLIFVMLWLFTQPVLLLVVVAVLIIVVICCNAK